MTDSQAKILIVDDRQQGREAMADVIKQNFGYQVCSPNSPEELEEAITFEVFDSVLADVDLSKWKMPDTIDDRTIKDGTDIAKLYRDLHAISSSCVYSTQDTFPDAKYARKIKESNVDFIPKLNPSFGADELKEDFEPFLQKTEHSYKSNPLFQPISYGHKYPAEQLQIYKRACRLHAGWMNFNFKSVGDSAWGVICGRIAEKQYYGLDLNGNGAKKVEFKVEKRASYPTPDEFNWIAAARDAFPFVIWNTRKVEFLRKQFQQAGPGLINIPKYLRDFFEVAMAAPLAEAYQGGMHNEAIDWCQQLNQTGKIQTVKQIYKKLYKTPALEDFRQRCKAANLPQVVEIYQARVDGIKEQNAWIEMKDWYSEVSDRARSMELFDLLKLRKYGVHRVNQRFEYLVYEMSNDDVAMNIELVDAAS